MTPRDLFGYVDRLMQLANFVVRWCWTKIEGGSAIAGLVLGRFGIEVKFCLHLINY